MKDWKYYLILKKLCLLSPSKIKKAFKKIKNKYIRK